MLLYKKRIIESALLAEVTLLNSCVYICLQAVIDLRRLLDKENVTILALENVPSNSDPSIQVRSVKVANYYLVNNPSPVRALSSSRF